MVLRKPAMTLTNCAMTCALDNPFTPPLLMKKLLLAAFIFFSFYLMAQPEIPELWGMRVHDEAGLLSVQMREQLEAALKQYEDSTSNQIAVLIIPSLQGAVLEDYSLRVAEKWKLGQADKDNGVLLLIAVEDRKMRIEVGYGLEGVLPDVICNRIIRNEIAPRFRRGEFNEGVWAGIMAITQAIGGEYVAGEDTTPNSLGMNPGEKALISLFIFGILGLFTFIGLKLKGGSAWFMYVFLIPFYASFPSFILGFSTGVAVLIAYLVGWPVLRYIFKSKGWNTMESYSGSGGGWSGGGWSSGGGGFSGGGGSFGGGGSSGGW